jgi:hypothetical protein
MHNMNTTIAVSKELRDQIKEFGNKGEKYDEILSRLLDSAKERQLHDLLMDEKGTVPINEALARARKRWQK